MDQNDNILKALSAMDRATVSEKRHLAEQPDIRFADGKPVMVFPPPLQGNTYEEKLASFAKIMYLDNHEPTPDEVAAFVSGKPVGTSHDQALVVDEWADDPAPVEQHETTTEQPAPVAEPSPAAAPEAPVDNDAPALPPNHAYVRTLPDGKIVALFTDESTPRSPARQVILDPKRLRKQRAQTARAAMSMRHASDNGCKRITRF